MMGKRIIENEDENSKELQTLKQHLEKQDGVLAKQDEAIKGIEKALVEIKFLLSGSLMGKTKGLIEMFTELSHKLDEWISKVEHAEKWRLRFIEGEKERKEMVAKKRMTEEERAHQESLKDKDIEAKYKEIEALKKSNAIKNWIAVALALVGVLKWLFDYFK